MSKYVGIKLVEAAPMSLEEFNKIYPNRVVNPISGNNNGYCVTYLDGYQGWCPSVVFEEANIRVEDITISTIKERFNKLLNSNY